MYRYGQLSFFTFLRVRPQRKWRPKQQSLATCHPHTLNEGLWPKHIAVHDTEAKHSLKARHISLQASPLPAQLRVVAHHTMPPLSQRNGSCEYPGTSAEAKTAALAQAGVYSIGQFAKTPGDPEKRKVTTIILYHPIQGYVFQCGLGNSRPREGYFQRISRRSNIQTRGYVLNHVV